ncbi:hypothetical protein RvY_04700-2 [Ramazzottius varieornatus]|uniref:RING-type domain-containing protein n=1 Tax=Ramazzottius varieornatus TaxID=947166 RepID=A0A1D1USJ6_RAMVA|nr:hypothetical protein RvY_04700-2 [Ramazzottius varieornatus]
MAVNLTCNYPSCCKTLQDQAWISSCSHTFCDEHGLLEFTGQRISKCPLCLTELGNPLDIIKTDINPSEQYKSMILAGQRPEVVIEMAARSLAFWNYQMQLQFSREKQDKSEADRVARESLLKITQEKTSLRVELEGMQKKNSDLENALAEKSRQNLKLSSSMDAMRVRMAEQDARQQRSSPSGNTNSANHTPPRFGFITTNQSVNNNNAVNQTPINFAQLQGTAGWLAAQNRRDMEEISRYRSMAPPPPPQQHRPNCDFSSFVNPNSRPAATTEDGRSPGAAANRAPKFNLNF